MAMIVSSNPFHIAVASTRSIRRFQTDAYVEIVLSLNELFHAQPNDSEAKAKTEVDDDDDA